MKNLISEIRAAVMVTLALAVACCVIYPLAVCSIGQLLFRDKANGSLIVDKDGTIHGSRLIGQQFTLDKYFHLRPSYAGANGMACDPTSSSGSNLGPTSQKLHDTIAQGVSDYRTQNGMDTNAAVPADAVTASASGLDPHISLRNAELQTPRVAKARGLSEDKVRELIRANTDEPSLGFLGEPGVNVLSLNLALDALTPAGKRGPMKKLLVPLTLSREPHAALPVAAHFAQACNATVALLHVVQRGFVEGGTEAAWALPLSESYLPAAGDGLLNQPSLTLSLNVHQPF